MVAKLIDPPTQARPGVLHPAAYHSYPEGTPRMERLPSDFRDNGHTAATWEAFITAPAVVEANIILAAAEQLHVLLRAWLKKHGAASDPGAAAILAAGLPLPASVAELGTDMLGVGGQLAGLAWAVESAIGALDTLPDTDDPQNVPENVRRLLAGAGQ